MDKAIADVLYGDYNPSGKLTSTWYNARSDLPNGMLNYDIRDAKYTYMYHDKTPAESLFFVNIYILKKRRRTH